MGFGLNIPVGPPFGFGQSNPFGSSVPATPLPLSGRFVFVKRQWSDNWRYFPYLTPVSATEAAAPEVSRARLQYTFGTIMREDSTQFSSFQSYDLRNWYVQIRIANPYSGQVQPVWTGVIDDNDYDFYYSNLATGDQEIDAYGQIGRAHV